MIFVREDLFGYFSTAIAELIGILEVSICKINKFIVDIKDILRYYYLEKN